MKRMMRIGKWALLFYLKAWGVMADVVKVLKVDSANSGIPGVCEKRGEMIWKWMNYSEVNEAAPILHMLYLVQIHWSATGRPLAMLWPVAWLLYHRIAQEPHVHFQICGKALGTPLSPVNARVLICRHVSSWLNTMTYVLSKSAIRICLPFYNCS